MRRRGGAQWSDDLPSELIGKILEYPNQIQIADKQMHQQSTATCGVPFPKDDKGKTVFPRCSPETRLHEGVMVKTMTLSSATTPSFQAFLLCAMKHKGPVRVIIDETQQPFDFTLSFHHDRSELNVLTCALNQVTHVAHRGKEIHVLCKLLPALASLTDLDLKRDFKEVGMKSFTDALSKNASLRRLDMSINAIVDIELLSHTLPASIKTLFLNDNKIGNIKPLVEAVTKNKLNNLETLFLQKNKIEDGDAFALTRALQKNSQMTKFQNAYLRDNLTSIKFIARHPVDSRILAYDNFMATIVWSNGKTRVNGPLGAYSATT